LLGKVETFENYYALTYLDEIRPLNDPETFKIA
jgi:hypothetical protein